MSLNIKVLVWAGMAAIIVVTQALAPQLFSDTTVGLVANMAVLLSLGMIAWGTFKMRQSTQQLLGFCADLGDKMDFSKRIDLHDSTEVGQIAKGLNKLLASIESGLNDTTEVMQSLSQGDFSKRGTAPLKGDFARLQSRINQSVETTSNAITQVNMVTQQLAAGELDLPTKPSLPGTYGEMIDNTYLTVATLKNIFSELNTVLAQAAQGLLTGRVNCQVNGEYQQLKNNVNRSLENLQKSIYETAEVMISQGTGDLTSRVKGNYRGTLGILKEGVNGTVSNTASMLSQSNYASLKLSTSALEISHEVTELAERTHQQAAAVEQTAAAMEQITSTVKSTAENAQQANDVAMKSMREAQEANEVVKNTIDAIHEISASSSKISEITSLIDSIAFQTNLLALNAAVEAARAGEHGRGFAVVAGEVRQLAGKSAEAAREIRLLIDDTVSKVAEGAQRAEASGVALELINTSITNISNFVEEISRTTAEQAQGVEQVNLAIAEIDQVTQNNPATVQKTEVSAKEVMSLAEQVQTLSKAFKIDLQQIAFDSAMQTGNFTFANARRAHRQWKGIVQAVVDGMEVDFNQQAAVDHTQCALGQWFYGEQGQAFAHLPEMKQVEQHHIQLHQTIKQIFQAKDSQDTDLLLRLFDELTEHSESVILALTAAERSVAQSQATHSSVGHSNVTPLPVKAKSNASATKPPTSRAATAAHKPMTSLPSNVASINKGSAQAVSDEWDEF